MKPSKIARLASRACVLFLVLSLAGATSAGFAAQAVERSVRPALYSEAALATADDPASVSPTERAATVSYAGEIAAVGGSGADTLAPVAFDDAWFLSDDPSYNESLASTCAVLSAACNASSLHYTNGAKDYAVCALEELGFEDADSSSYRTRSTVADELAGIARGNTGVSAYVFARKTLHDAAGEDAGELVFVGVRGTYGGEWLSNFDLGTAGPHAGFDAAKRETALALERYLDAHRIDEARCSFLVTGHSRGGAVANLLAADLVNARDASDRPASVRAYTFGAPLTTRDLARSDERYDCICNLENPSDIVCRVPFSAWGFGRYGITATLPDRAGSGCDEAVERMRGVRAALTGYDIVGFEGAVVPADGLDDLDSSAESCAPSIAEAAQPSFLAAAAGFFMGVDVPRMAAAHCPDTYVAWTYAVDASRISFSRL